MTKNEAQMEAEKILESYLTAGTANDNKIPAAVGILTSGRTKELIIALDNLNKTIQTKAANVIESNNDFARWTKILSVSLIIVTLAIGLLQAYVIWQTSKNQSEKAKISEVGR